MSDHTSETIQQIQSRQDSEAAYVRDYILGGQGLCFDEDSIPLILNHIDSFISQSRDDVYVQKVFWWSPASFTDQDDDVWDKVGQAIGNLQALKAFKIAPLKRDYSDDDDDDDEVIHDWEILARVLRHVRKRITLSVSYGERLWPIEEVQAFARVIHMGIPPLQVLTITAGSPTNPWILCFLP
jgi:hypothetical protein